MVFNNDLSISTDHHHTGTPHGDTDTDTNNTNTDADETVTLLARRRGNSTHMSAFGLVGLVIGFVALSLSTFVFLLNQRTSLSSSSSVALINSNNNGADMEDTDVAWQDNILWFTSENYTIVKAKFLYGPTKGYMVSDGEPYGGVGNTHRGRLWVKAGRHGTPAVADAFNNLEGDTLSFKYGWHDSTNPSSPPESLNFYVISDLQIESFGTIKHVALGQGYRDGMNMWWIKSPNCGFNEEHPFPYYICNLTNGKYFVLEGIDTEDVDSVDSIRIKSL